MIDRSKKRLLELERKAALSEAYVQRLKAASEQLRKEQIIWTTAAMICLSVAAFLGTALFMYLRGASLEASNIFKDLPFTSSDATVMVMNLLVIALVSGSIASFFRFLELSRVSRQIADAISQIMHMGYSARRLLKDDADA